MLARAAVCCWLLGACSAAAPAARTPPPLTASLPPNASATSATSTGSGQQAATGEPANGESLAAEPAASARTELVLADEQVRDVIVRFDSAACGQDNGSDLEIVITLDGEVHDTFTIATDNAPASCAEYGRQVELGDYNFDGNEDLAVPVDNAGSYGGPTYAILLYQPLNGHYVQAPQLSALTRENLGLFTIDPQRKRLTTFNKSGCCVHIKTDFTVSGDAPSVVNSEVESIIFEENNCHVLLERTRPDGKTHSSKRRCNSSEMP